MDIFLSVNNREEILQIPVIPPEFSISKPQNNSVFETATQGELKILGVPKLRSISFNSFFPVRDYPFLKTREKWGFEYTETLDRWISQKLPMRLVITETPINMAVCVDSFEYTIGKDGNLNYSISLSEFPMPQVV
jgi:hypothetical protein